MDWLDPKYSKQLGKAATKSKRMGKQRSLSARLNAATSQSIVVWSEAFDQALAALDWPAGVTVENSFLWSTVIHEQAETLVRAGMSARKLSAIVAESAVANAAQEAERVATVVGLMNQNLEQCAFEWLDTAAEYADSALGTIAIAWHLPDHARRPAGEWTVQWLQAVTDRLATNSEFDSGASALSGLVLKCELPLLAAVLTAASRKSIAYEASAAMDCLAEMLECSEDDPSPWLAFGATYLRAALASVLRCRVLADSLGLRGWYPPQRKALGKLLVHAARWARSDGTQLLAAGTNSPKAIRHWEALSKLARLNKGQQAALATNRLAATSGGKPAKAVREYKMPAFSCYDETASGAMMQSGWDQKGGRVAVDFSDAEICLEALGPKGTPLLAGEWSVQIKKDGQAQLPLDEWSEVCWFSDEDVDYLELEASHGQDVRVQRQIMLLREDRLLFVADALLSESEGDWEMTSRLPLGASMSYLAEQKNTEGYIESRAGVRCPVWPLYLPEWRSAAGSGSLGFDGDALVAQVVSAGKSRIYAPVLLSLCNRHGRYPFTWRQLTVGEDLRIVGSDEAAAFRVQLREEQLLFYRNLSRTIRRTALGMHTTADFYVGRIDAETGDLDPLLEVEASS